VVYNLLFQIKEYGLPILIRNNRIDHELFAEIIAGRPSKTGGFNVKYKEAAQYRAPELSAFWQLGRYTAMSFFIALAKFFLSPLRLALIYAFAANPIGMAIGLALTGFTRGLEIPQMQKVFGFALYVLGAAIMKGIQDDDKDKKRKVKVPGLKGQLEEREVPGFIASLMDMVFGKDWEVEYRKITENMPEWMEKQFKLVGDPNSDFTSTLNAILFSDWIRKITNLGFDQLAASGVGETFMFKMLMSYIIYSMAPDEMKSLLDKEGVQIIRPDLPNLSYELINMYVPSGYISLQLTKNILQMINGKDVPTFFYPYRSQYRLLYDTLLQKEKEKKEEKLEDSIMDEDVLKIAFAKLYEKGGILYKDSSQSYEDFYSTYTILRGEYNEQTKAVDNFINDFKEMFIISFVNHHLEKAGIDKRFNNLEEIKENNVIKTPAQQIIDYYLSKKGLEPNSELPPDNLPLITVKGRKLKTNNEGQVIVRFRDFKSYYVKHFSEMYDKVKNSENYKDLDSHTEKAIKYYLAPVNNRSLDRGSGNVVLDFYRIGELPGTYIPPLDSRKLIAFIGLLSKADKKFDDRLRTAHLKIPPGIKNAEANRYKVLYIELQRFLGQFSRAQKKY